MTIYYNDIDGPSVAWLRNLIKAKLIPSGVVDNRGIADVKEADLEGFTQHHFFAGIAGWSRALAIAGWPKSRPVWTGSCPCQPFSTIGQRSGFDDARHVWPTWLRLIRKCHPPVIFGEQVSSGNGVWLDKTFTDLEDEGYACGAAVLPAVGLDARHKRDRFYFVAYTPSLPKPKSREKNKTVGTGGNARLELDGSSTRQLHRESSKTVAHATSELLNWQRGWSELTGGDQSSDSGWWSTEPDLGRLADGVPGRVVKLRGLGNSIVPQVAAEFIKATMSCIVP